MNAKLLAGRVLAAVTLAGLCVTVQAAEIDGGRLAAAWSIPFAGMLLSIAILPLAMPDFWHHHFGKIAAAWSLALDRKSTRLNSSHG